MLGQLPTRDTTEWKNKIICFLTVKKLNLRMKSKTSESIQIAPTSLQTVASQLTLTHKNDSPMFKNPNCINRGWVKCIPAIYLPDISYNYGGQLSLNLTQSTY